MNQPPPRSRARTLPGSAKLWLLLALSLAANAVFLFTLFLRSSAANPPAGARASSAAPDSFLLRRTERMQNQVATKAPARGRDAPLPNREPTPAFTFPANADEVPSDPGSQQADQRPQLDNLPREKQEQLQRIASDYAELTEEIYAKTNGLIPPEDREKLVWLEKEKNTDLAKMLTPPELEEYQFRANDTVRLHRR